MTSFFLPVPLVFILILINDPRLAGEVKNSRLKTWLASIPITATVISMNVPQSNQLFEQLSALIHPLKALVTG